MKIVSTVEELAEAIGLQPGDTVRIATPQFTRPAHWPAPGGPPGTPEGWSALREMNRAALEEMGLGCWDGRLMLFPGEWYARIPAGFRIEDIGGKVEAFAPGETDNDIRYGCLAYGVPAVDGVAEEDL